MYCTRIAVDCFFKLTRLFDQFLKHALYLIDFSLKESKCVILSRRLMIK